MTVPVSVSRYAGARWIFSLVHRDAANAPINMTGYTPEGELRWLGHAPVPLTVENGCAELLNQTGAPGQFKIYVPQSITEDIEYSATPRPAWLRIGYVDQNGYRNILNVLNILVVTP